VSSPLAAELIVFAADGEEAAEGGEDGVAGESDPSSSCANCSFSSLMTGVVRRIRLTM